jgi:hypothetical protein
MGGADAIAGLCGTPDFATKECRAIIEETDCGSIVEYDGIEDLTNKVTCCFKIHVFVN